MVGVGARDRDRDGVRDRVRDGVRDMVWDVVRNGGLRNSSHCLCFL